MTHQEKLEQLADFEGYEDYMEMLEVATRDSVVPGICVNEDCDYTTGVEPDSDSGWCEVCEKNSVHSCLILGGII